MTTPDLTAEAHRAELIRAARRMVAYPVPADPVPWETGFTTVTRELAQELTRVLRGRAWDAVTVEQRHRVAIADTESQQVVIIDDVLLIVVTHAIPAGTIRDRWTLTLNGQPVAHRAWPGILPWSPLAVVESVWRHVRLIDSDPCDYFTCRDAATAATVQGSYCAQHVNHY